MPEDILFPADPSIVAPVAIAGQILEFDGTNWVAVTRSPTTSYPDGVTVVSDTIELGRVYGGIWEGAGAGQQTSPTHVQRGRMSELVWDGAANSAGYGDPIMYSEGYGMTLRDLCLRGKYYSGHDDFVDTKAHIGLHLRKTQAGIATGYMNATNIYISDCEIAIQTSELADGSSGNGSNNSWNRITAQDCDTFFQSNSIQDHMNSFNGCVANGCTTMFDIQAGGKLSARDCGTYDTQATTFLNIGADSAETWWRQGVFHFTNTTFDAQKPVTSKMLVMNVENLRVLITFDQFSLGNHDVPIGNDMFHVAGASTLKLVNGQGLQEGTIIWDEPTGSLSTYGNPKIIIDNCRIADGEADTMPTLITDLFYPDGSNGTLEFTITNCADTFGKPYPDSKGTITDAGVVTLA